MGEETGAYRVLVGKPEGKRPLGRPRRRWEDSIQMGLQEVECRVMEWVELAQDRYRRRSLVNAVMNRNLTTSLLNSSSSNNNNNNNNKNNNDNNNKLQRTRRNIFGRRSTRVRLTFRAFPL
jgi:hypothetical protein